jgi:hypothetical protein
MKKLARLLTIILLNNTATAGEVLIHISDETDPAISPAKTETTPSDRHIIYRVICSPEGEQLPDCELSSHSTEETNDNKKDTALRPTL